MLYGLAYQTMVKPLMFFGTPAWHPSTGVKKTKLARLSIFFFVYLPKISSAYSK
jgi:hypothetical protein